jgi:hypothetical protein
MHPAQTPWIDTVHDLTNFRLADMIVVGRELRALGRDASSMEEVARRIVDFLYDGFRVRETNKTCCALVRCFKTHRFDLMPQDLQRLAKTKLEGAPVSPELRCLTLLASRGDEPDWNDRRKSTAHQAIPLLTPEIVEQTPMIARLIRQMGMSVAQIVQPEQDLLVDLEQQSFNVFHVEDALGSKYVPAQNTFVVPYGVKSALGFGGMLPSGELFSIVLFSKVRITRETAQLFRTLALGVKLALLPFAGKRVFEN